MKNTTDTRSLTDVLDLLALHVESMLETPPGREHVSGLSYGDELAMVRVKITASSWTEKTDSRGINVWDQCTVNGVHAGNRCGARAEMMKVYAPIVALAAAAEAARAEAA